MVDEAQAEGLVDQTALGSAAVRAVHLVHDGEPKILRDEYALPLTGWTTEQLAWFAQEMVRHESQTSTWVARGRFAEDRVVAARTRGVGQYVILGAGLDSFALRHADTLGDLVVYEVDTPPMQTWKRRRVEELDLAVPEGLRFVPYDFETATLGQALAKAEFGSGAPAVVSWLAVTQYLTREAVTETLRWAAGLAPGSEIILTFVVPGPEAEANRERLAAIGVRFETFFTPEDMTAVISGAGLRAEVFTPEQVEDRYFQDRNDGLRASTVEWLSVGSVV
jgi:methyltransferase (TIGR00027 family)